MKPGDSVEIQTKDGDILTGLVMPSNDKNILSLKLSSGYNVNIDNKKVVKCKVLSVKKEVKEAKVKKEVKK